MTETLTPPGELLNEADALKLYQNFSTLRPDQVPRAKEKLKAYRDTQLSRQEPLWPSAARLERQQGQEMEKMWLDDVLVPGKDDEEKALIREYGFISALTKQPGYVVAQSPDRLRRAVADYLGNPAAGESSQAFAELAKGHLKKQRDLRILTEGTGREDDTDKATNDAAMFTAAWNSARDNKPAADGFAEWQRAAVARPEWKAAAGEDLYSKFRIAHERAAGRWSDYRSRADGISKALEAATGNDSLSLDASAALPFVSGLTRQERGTVLALVKESEGAKAKGVGTKSGEAVGRVFARLLEGEADSLERLNTATTTFTEGQEVKAGMENNPAGLVQANLMSIIRAKAGGVSDGMAGAQDVGEWFAKKVKLTKDQADAANAENGRQREAIALKAQLRDIGRGVVDPVKGSNWASDLFYYGSLNLTASVASFATGGGMALNWNAYVEDERSRLENEGVDSGTAAVQAVAVGSAQAGLDRLSLGLLNKLTALKGLKSWMVSPAATGLAAAGRRVPSALAVTGGEALIEGAQDALPLLVQKAVVALGADEPDVAWGEIAKESWVSTEKTFFAMLPLALLGLGIGSHRDYKAARELVTDRPALAQLGFNPETIEQIATAPDAETGVRRLREAWGTREPIMTAATSAGEQAADGVLQDPTAPLPSVTRAAQAKAAFESRFTEGTALRESMAAEGITFEKSSRDGETIFKVTKGETTTEHDNAGSAFAAVMDQMAASDRAQNGPLIQMLAELEANPLSPVREGSFDLTDGQTVAEYQASRAAIMQDENAAPEARAKAESESAAMVRRQKVYENQFPDAPVDWRAVAVGGQSELMVKEGVARAVLRVSNGESAYTAFEEKVETEPREWIRTGQLTWEKFEKDLRQVETATGDKYINGFTDGQNVEQDRLALIEAYSELAQVHATAKSRAGKLAPSGIAEVAGMDRKGTAEAFRGMQKAAGNTARTDRSTARRNLLQAIAQGRIASELVQRLKAQVEWLMAVVTKARRLNAARRQAGGSFAIDEFLNKSVGIETESQHAAAVVAEAVRIYTTPAPDQSAEDVGFRLTPIATLDKLADQMAKQTRDPEARRRVYLQMTRALDSLRARWTETRAVFDAKGKQTGASSPLGEKRTKRELDKEQAFREAIAAQEAEALVYDSLTPEAQAALGMTSDDTSAYKGTLAQRFTGGRFGTRGRIQTRADSLRNSEALDFSAGGEYDGAEGLPPMFFGGSLSVDLAAQEAYEAGEIADAKPDTLWDALRKELQTQAGNRDNMKAALASLKDAQKKAKASAKAEVAQWRIEQEEQQAKDWDGRAVMLRHLRTLDAVLSALPPEVRAKVGGWTAVASLRTQEAMQKELELRLKKADEYLEEAIKEDVRDTIGKVLEKAKPKVGENRIAKGKLTAETHAILDKVRAYAAMTIGEAQAALVNAQATIDGAADEAALNKAWDEYLTLDTTGALFDNGPGGKTAAELTDALDFIENVYVKGRTGFAVLAEANKVAWDGWRGAIISKLGKATSDDAANRIQKDKKPGVSALRTGEQIIESLFNIHQQMIDLLGENHEVTRNFSKRIRNARETARQEAHGEQVALFEWIKSRLGVKSKARQAILLSSLSQTVESPVFRIEGRQTTTDEISIDLARQIASGAVKDNRYPSGSSQFKMLGESLRAYEDALKAWDAKPDGRRPERKYLEVDRVTDRGTRQRRTMSQMDAINDTLLWQQERYREANMERHGLGQEYIDQVEAWLSPEAKSIREFIRSRYGSEYAGMNQTFRALFNMNMPQEKNYARAGFITPGMDMEAMGPDGLPSSPGGASIGSIKGRIAHKAEPKRQNALALRMAHVAQISHWKAAAVLARDLRAVFSPVEVRNSIITKHGEAAYNRLLIAIKTFESGGWREAMANLDAHDMIQRLIGTGVANSLAYNLGSVMAQVPAAIVGKTRLGPVAWSKAAARLVANPKLLAEIYNDPAVVLRRGPVFSRGQVFSMLSGERRNIVAQEIMRIGEMGTELLGDADAALTTINGAIAYLAHFDHAKEAGLSDADAKATARDLMRLTIEETAQPDDFTRKSNFENQVSAGKGISMLALRGLFMFKSAARAASANIFLTFKQIASKDISPTDGAGRLVALLVVVPLLEQAMRSLYRDMASDDSDEELWQKPSTWLAAIASAPFAGIPGVGSIWDAAKVQVVGGYTVTVQDPATRLIMESMKISQRIMDGKAAFDFDSITSAAHLVALGLSVYGVPGGEAIEGFLNIGKTVTGAAENLDTTDGQKDQDYRIKLAEKKAWDAKKEAERVRRAGLSDEARKAEDAAAEAEKAKDRARRVTKFEGGQS